MLNCVNTGCTKNTSVKTRSIVSSSHWSGDPKNLKEFSNGQTALVVVQHLLTFVPDSVIYVYSIKRIFETLACAYSRLLHVYTFTVL